MNNRDAHVRIVVFVVLALSGCAVLPPPVLQPEELAMLKKAKVYSIIGQDQIVGQVIEGDDHNLGIIGGILAAKQTIDRYNAMNAQMAPLRSLVGDLDFRHVFRDRLRHTFSQQELAGISSMTEVNEMPQGSERRDWVQKQITAANGQPVLMLSTSYRLEPKRYASLIVTTNVDLFMPGSQTASFSSKVEYESVPVTAYVSYYHSWKKAMSRWEENRAGAYRAACREAINETMTMLRLMLVYRPKALQASEGQKEVAKDKYRSIVAKSGALYSWPRLLRYSTMLDSFPKPAPNKGRVYVYRDLDAFAMFQPTVHLNQRGIGVLNQGGFLFADIPAGEYEMSLSHEETGFLDGMNSSLAQRFGTIKFLVVNGKEAYIKLHSTGGTLFGEQRLEIVEPARGLAELQGRWPADGLYPEFVVHTRLINTH